MTLSLTSSNEAVAEHVAPEIPIWEHVRDEAMQLARREAFFAELPIFEILTASNDVQAVLAHAIADRLGGVNASKGRLEILFHSVLNESDEIMIAAEADLRAVRRRDPACTTFLHALLNLKGYHALKAYRIANHLWNENRREIARWLSNYVSLIFGPGIHPAAKIGSSIMLDHASGIVIGETTVIDNNVSILQVGIGTDGAYLPGADGAYLMERENA